MQAGDSLGGAPMGVTGVQSRSEDEESVSVKDMKRTTTQAFGSGVPKRRSSSRFDFFFFFSMGCLMPLPVIDYPFLFHLNILNYSSVFVYIYVHIYIYIFIKTFPLLNKVYKEKEVR